MLGTCGAWSLQCFVSARRIWHTGWRLPHLATVVLGVIVCLGWPLEASSGPDEPGSEFSGCSQSVVITIDHFWARWMLQTCSNMPYTASVPSIVYLVWALEASRGSDKPKITVFGMFPERHYRDGSSWARWTLPTCSNIRLRSYHCPFD